MIATIWVLNLLMFGIIYSATGLTWKYFAIVALLAATGTLWKLVGAKESK